mgnify:CR=1 FL=1
MEQKPFVAICTLAYRLAVLVMLGVLIWRSYAVEDAAWSAYFVAADAGSKVALEREAAKP